ncbi:branched-chain amino acid aminotransferase [Flavobacteriaceae bacterium]|nr:branched-chain amino acid aminotransferase [Flavobacteriaceae bacterium]
MSITIKKSTETKIDGVDFENLAFGNIFTDHMFVCDYEDGKWVDPRIEPYGPLSLDPSAKVFHYGQAVFEGMKAYKDQDDQIWLFRPEDNFNRINISGERLAMPAFPKDFFFEGLEELLKLDAEWIKKGDGNSLYVRPFVIATESGVSASPSKSYKFMIICSPAQSYYSGEVRVLIAEKYSRSANGGVGFAKAAGNYAGQFYPTNLALADGFQQVIWTDADTHKYLEEAGTMNVFVKIGDKLITAPTSERILDGITRKSLIDLAKSENIEAEIRAVSVEELVSAAKDGSLKEMFGSGTAAVISPISGFSYQGTYYDIPKSENGTAAHLKKRLTDIQQNKAEDKFNWTHKVS